MKKRRGKKVNIDADLDGDFENYQPSDSDDGFDENDRDLLANAVGRKRDKEEEEVLKVYSSSEDSDEEDGVQEDDDDEEEDDKALYGGGVGSDMDSDIEGKERDDGLPDSRAWGSDKKQYYDTDYVDKDYLGFDDEEAAFEEEKEADVIQRRLMSHLEGTDFTLGLLDSVEDKKKQVDKKREDPEVDEDEEKVEVDLSKLSPEELLELVKRKSPEMFPIIEQCKARILYLKDKVVPVLELVDTGIIKRSKVIDFLEIMHTLILNYTVVVLFYLHLKEMGKRTSDHPVIKRLRGLNLLLNEMDALRKKVDPQIDVVLEKVENGEDIREEENEQPEEPAPKNRKERRKRKLELLRKKEEEDALIELKKQKLLKLQETNFEEELEKRANKQEKSAEVLYSEEDESDSEDGMGTEDKERVETEKRAVTFEILKNKGLTPRRKKENRNPRVKNRNKFKKALVRRKGQVRQPRKELNRYGGEISGIKAHVRKSIKLN